MEKLGYSEWFDTGETIGKSRSSRERIMIQPINIMIIIMAITVILVFCPFRAKVPEGHHENVVNRNESGPFDQPKLNITEIDDKGTIDETRAAANDYTKESNDESVSMDTIPPMVPIDKVTEDERRREEIYWDFIWR